MHGAVAVPLLSRRSWSRNVSTATNPRPRQAVVQCAVSWQLGGGQDEHLRVIFVAFGATLVLPQPICRSSPIPMAIFGITPEAAWIAITCRTGIVWSIFTLLIRTFLRCKVNGPWGLDDNACALATVSFCWETGYTLQGDVCGPPEREAE